MILPLMIETLNKGNGCERTVARELMVGWIPLM